MDSRQKLSSVRVCVCLRLCVASQTGGVKSYGNLLDSHRPFPTQPEAAPHQNMLP